MRTYSLLAMFVAALLNLTLYTQAAIASTPEVWTTNDNISNDDWEKISSKLKNLPIADYATIAKCEGDWLIDPSRFKAGVWAGEDGKSIIISNGLVARVFRITPNLATVDIINQMTSESMLRAVSSEGEVVINGKRWHLGGLDGQSERGYFRTEWLEQMTAKKESFIVEDFDVEQTIPTLKWARSRWALNKSLPTGKSLLFTLRGVGEVKDLKVKLYYDIYDHIPLIRKRMEIFNNGEPVNLDSFKLEYLAFAEPESPVEEKDVDNFLLPNIHIESAWSIGWQMRSTPRRQATDYVLHASWM